MCLLFYGMNKDNVLSQKEEIEQSVCFWPRFIYKLKLVLSREIAYVMRGRVTERSMTILHVLPPPFSVENKISLNLT